MRHVLNLLILMATALLTVCCTGCDNTNDVLEQKATSKSSFNQVKGMADSLYSCMHFRDAYVLYLQLLDTKEAESDSEKKMSVLNALSTTSELVGTKAEQVKWLEQLMDVSKQTGNNYYHSLAHITMGQNVFYEGDREKGIQNVKEAIDLMEKCDRPDADHLMHCHLIMLARLYGEIKDNANALKTDERNLQLTMEGTRWGDVPNQQLIDRRMALAKLAAVLAKMQNFQRADSAYAAWKAVQYEGNHTRDYFIVDYLKRRGRYQEAVPIYNDLIQRVRQQGDTLGEMMNSAKWGLAEAYRKMGRYQQAAFLYEQVLEIQDTLRIRKAKHTAQELAAVYHAQDQEQTIMQQEAENARQRYLLFVVIAILLSVMAIAAIIFAKNRTISRKNHLLAQQIAETVNYKKMYWEEHKDQPLAAETDNPNALSDEQLFRHINEVIVREHLFRNPGFGRQAIMDRFSLSKERVGAVFSKVSEHGKLNSHILQIRLDYAAQLLVNQPDMSIADVATESGFGSNSYFASRFSQHFGISPTDFRRDAGISAE